MPPTVWIIWTTASVSWTKTVRPSMPATAVWMLWTKPCACWPRMATRTPHLNRDCSMKAGWKSAAGAFITIWTKETSRKNCSRFWIQRFWWCWFACSFPLQSLTCWLQPWPAASWNYRSTQNMWQKGIWIRNFLPRIPMKSAWWQTVWGRWRTGWMIWSIRSIRWRSKRKPASCAPCRRW